MVNRGSSHVRRSDEQNVRTWAAELIHDLRSDRSFLAFLVIIFLNGLIVGPFLPFLPIYIDQELGTTQALTADFRTVSLALMALFILAGAVISDGMGPKASVLAGLAATPLVSIAFLTDATWLLFAIAAFHGVAEALFHGGSQTYLVEVAPPRWLASATALFFAGQTIGVGLGAALGGVILEVGSFTLLASIMLGTAIPLLAVAALVLPTVTSEGRQRPSLREVTRGYVSIVRRGAVWSFALMQFLRTVFWGAASLAMPFLLHRLTGSTTVVGWFSAISLVLGMVSMLLVGSVSDRLGRRSVVIALLLALGGSGLLLAVTVHHAAGFFVAGIVATVGAWTLSGQITPLAKELAGPGESGRLVGMVLFPWALAMLLGAQFHGHFTEQAPRAMFLVLALLVMAGLVAGVFSLRAAGAGPAAAIDRSLPGVLHDGEA